MFKKRIDKYLWIWDFKIELVDKLNFLEFIKKPFGHKYISVNNASAKEKRTGSAYTRNKL
jgi:hypothetical protein